jgi:hypothetical protein
MLGLSSATDFHAKRYCFSSKAAAFCAASPLTGLKNGGSAPESIAADDFGVRPMSVRLF